MCLTLCVVSADDTRGHNTCDSTPAPVPNARSLHRFRPTPAEPRARSAPPLAVAHAGRLRTQATGSPVRAAQGARADDDDDDERGGHEQHPSSGHTKMKQRNDEGPHSRGDGCQPVFHGSRALQDLTSRKASKMHCRRRHGEQAAARQLDGAPSLCFGRDITAPLPS